MVLRISAECRQIQIKELSLSGLSNVHIYNPEQLFMIEED